MKSQGPEIKGVYPALVTPLNEDETVNTAVLQQLISDLETQGADGFYVGGATGEGLALSTEVRQTLTETVINAVSPGKTVIIQVAAMHFNDMLTLARHAEESGAAAISATAPLFFSYDENDVWQYYKRLAEHVHIPLMVYYSPAARFPMNADFAARLFEIDNVTAIKWTSSDFYQLLRLKDITSGEMTVMNGSDEMLLSGLCAGADGGIGTTYNFQLKNIRGLYDAFRQADMEKARAFQRQAVRIIAASFENEPIIPATKAILEQMGYAVGNAAFPMKRYTEKEKEEIFAKVSKYL